MAGRRPITQRPAGARNRSRLGHWEGDTVEGSHKQSFLVTLVDRKSRYGLLGKALDKSSATINAVIDQLLGRLPEGLRRTGTLDNGTEFSGFTQLEEQLGMTIYFANPYSPWQRGSNEQFNGLLRMFLPKGTDFRHVSDKRLAQIQSMLNNRPRKCLNYRTPAEVFFTHRGVALRT
jgi:transposase, IS30 family